MASHLGKTVEEIMDMSNTEYMYWIAYHNLIPFSNPWLENACMRSALTGEKVKKLYPGKLNSGQQRGPIISGLQVLAMSNAARPAREAEARKKAKQENCGKHD